MEEEKELNYPYYETTYLDDNNTKHLINIKSEKDLDFYKERFTILSSEYICE